MDEQSLRVQVLAVSQVLSVSAITLLDGLPTLVLPQPNETG